MQKTITTPQFLNYQTNKQIDGMKNDKQNQRIG